MKKIIHSIIAFLALSMNIYAQDARQRTVETIAQDVMAAIPTDNLADFYVQMEDLAKSAPESVTYLASKLRPSDSGANNVVEYAISGVVRYATDPANAEYKADVKEGLEQAIKASRDKYNKQFLEAQLRLMQPFEDPYPAAMLKTYSFEDVKALEKSGESRKECQALWLYADNLGTKSAKKLLAALKSDDRAVRTTALLASEQFADDEFFLQVAKVYRKLSPEAKSDLIQWFGKMKADAQLDLILSELNAGGELGANAIEAAARIGGEKSAAALFKLLEGPYAKNALKALKYIDVDITDRVWALLPDAKGAYCMNLLDLASSKVMYETSADVIKLAASQDKDIAKAAAKALSGVVKPENFNALASLMDAAEGNIEEISKALKASLKNLSADEKFAAVSSYIKAASKPERFYSIVADAGNKDAVAFLKERYEGGSDAALEALSVIMDPSVAPVLLSAADKDQKYLRNFVNVIEANVKETEKKFHEYSLALAKASDKDVRNYILQALGNVHSMNAFTVLGSYLDDPDYSYVAANGVKAIASDASVELDYYSMQDILTKAMAVFGSTGDADDGYAVDEIRKILDGTKPFEKFELSAEEKRLGYEVLYDGTDLSKWIGDKQGYTSVNGCINVTASYGNERNLYTEKEYTDFILRFEFCFEKPGVNNGVGIRTPMGVDAAYFGMCEVQVLDHDAPIYADLRPYQVHGSVYGVVPAKRIVHKPLGEWSCEEIRVKGDRVTVIVNGEVIVDADVRKACKGHNVSPDGGEYNPFTVDGRNHPGMFNRKGHIGFLGHGSGLKYRNVRVLDLSK